MSNKRLNLYHITSYDTMKLILDSKGIDPAKSEGKRNVSWYVTRALVGWAIAHCLSRHEVAFDKLVVLKVVVATKEVLRTSRRGIYCSNRALYPCQIDSAQLWLQRDERTVYIPSRRNLEGQYYGHK